MADWYVYSGATGTGTGASWANAKTTLAAATTASAAGDDIWVASDHNESTSVAQTITFAGTAVNPNRVISVSRAGSVPPVAADVTDGASVTTTGASSITINAAGAYVRGITFNCGTGSTTANLTASGVIIYENCSFNLLTTATSSRIVGSGAGSVDQFKNCAFTFSNAFQTINISAGGWIQRGGSVAATGTVPTSLFVASNYYQHILDGVDLSALSGKTVFGANSGQYCTISNCKLPASVTITPSNNNVSSPCGIRMVACNSTGSIERNEIYDGRATLTTETTVVRTNGASDGATPYSWNISSRATVKAANPFETFEGAVWNTTTGSSKTLTVHLVTDNVALNSGDVWLEVQYLGDNGSPITTLVSSGPTNILSTGSALTSDSGASWTTTGLTTPNKQKMSVSFTPQLAGLIRWKVKVAKPSTTLYVCPKADLT